MFSHNRLRALRLQILSISILLVAQCLSASALEANQVIISKYSIKLPSNRVPASYNRFYFIKNRVVFSDLDKLYIANSISGKILKTVKDFSYPLAANKDTLYTIKNSALYRIDILNGSTQKSFYNNLLDLKNPIYNKDAAGGSAQYSEFQVSKYYLLVEIRSKNAVFTYVFSLKSGGLSWKYIVYDGSTNYYLGKPRIEGNFISFGEYYDNQTYASLASGVKISKPETSKDPKNARNSQGGFGEIGDLLDTPCLVVENYHIICSSSRLFTDYSYETTQDENGLLVDNLIISTIKPKGRK